MPVTGNTEHTQPENRAYYPALDGLRAVAFFMVFLHHFVRLPWGWAGVDIFFVLSGFLITGILYDSREDAHRVRNFYVRRTLRIFPLYYGILLLVVLAAPVAHWQWSRAWLLWPTYLGNFIAALRPMAAGSTLRRMADFQMVSLRWPRLPVFYLGHLWTLCVEEQFYLVWPWVVFWLKERRRLVWICSAALPVGMLLRWAAQHQLPGWMLGQEVVEHTTPFRVDDLLFGGLLVLLLRGPHAAKLLRWTRRVAPFVFAAVLIWLVHITPLPHILKQPYPYPENVDTVGFASIALLAGALILLAIQPGTVVFRVLHARWLRWVGRISYGAYVFHDIFHETFERITIKMLSHLMAYHVHAGPRMFSLVTTGLDLAATLLLAWLSFRFYEGRFLELKERWTVRSVRPA